MITCSEESSMIITVHRGSHQIGGCATEIKTKNSRIIIDTGSELDGNNPLKIEGVTEGKSDCDAILFTHYHGDHIGLLDTVNKDIPLYIGDVSLEIIKLQNHRKKLFEDTDIQRILPYHTAKPMMFGDIKVTPFMVDHSAFDAHLFLIEADGKKVLHTGDFRNHGFRGKGLIPTLNKYIRKVDVVICEGTTLSRSNAASMTEYELSQKAATLFKDNKYVFVVCASTNIDRIAGLCSAVPEGKYCLCDNYQSDILEVIKRKCEKFSPLYSFKKMCRYGKNLDEKMEKQGFCMFIRLGNYFSTQLMEKYRDKNPLIIYSMWSGYLENNQELQELVKGFRLTKLHTSGHADVETIGDILGMLQPSAVIPIHTDAPVEIPYDKDKIVSVCDGQEIVI